MRGDKDKSGIMRRRIIRGDVSCLYLYTVTVKAKLCMMSWHAPEQKIY